MELFAYDCVCYRTIKDTYRGHTETSERYRSSIGMLSKKNGYEISTRQLIALTREVTLALLSSTSPAEEIIESGSAFQSLIVRPGKKLYL